MVELRQRAKAQKDRLLAQKGEYSALKDRDVVATLRTLEEVINLPETLPQPLRDKLVKGKEQ